MSRRHSLRWRITIWYAGLFSLQILLFSVFFDHLLSGKLRDRMDSALRSELDTAVAMFQDEMEEMKGDIRQAASETATGMRVGDDIVAVWSDAGFLAISNPKMERAVSIEIRPSYAGETELPNFGPHGARAATRSVRAGGHSVVILVLSPLDAVDEVMGTERRFLFVGIPLMMALAIAGGWVLASRGLAPLGSMARQARDITESSLNQRLEIGHAAEELQSLSASFNELLGRLDQSFDSMRRFVADASHELRTPLSVIRGEADVALSQEREAPDYKASLAIILDESRRLSLLVDDLLNLARADSGRVKLNIQEFYISDLLAECCRKAQSAATLKRINLTCEAGIDVSYRGDEGLLRRLVANLLDNAIRYTPEDGKISAELKVEPEALVIRIADSGPGIAPETAAHVFERFYRGDDARSRQEGGFGLGLSIVKWIAEAHNGTVRLASEPGAGSAFTVVLPR